MVTVLFFLFLFFCNLFAVITLISIHWVFRCVTICRHTKSCTRQISGRSDQVIRTHFRLTSLLFFVPCHRLSDCNFVQENRLWVVILSHLKYFGGRIPIRYKFKERKSFIFFLFLFLFFSFFVFPFLFFSAVHLSASLGTLDARVDSTRHIRLHSLVSNWPDPSRFRIRL